MHDHSHHTKATLNEAVGTLETKKHLHLPAVLFVSFPTSGGGCQSGIAACTSGGKHFWLVALCSAATGTPLPVRAGSPLFRLTGLKRQRRDRIPIAAPQLRVHGAGQEDAQRRQRRRQRRRQGQQGAKREAVRRPPAQAGARSAQERARSAQVGGARHAKKGPGREQSPKPHTIGASGATPLALGLRRFNALLLRPGTSDRIAPTLLLRRSKASWCLRDSVRRPSGERPRPRRARYGEHAPAPPAFPPAPPARTIRR